MNKRVSKRICMMEGCSSHVTGYNLCSLHYQRWKRHGDPLALLRPVGEPRAFIKKAVTYEKDDCLIWPYAKDGDGYGHIRHMGEVAGAHRVLCEMVYGPPPSPSHGAAHSCGNGHNGCVNPKHLRWATPAENQADRVLHGTANRGSRSPFAKMDEDTARRIKRLRGTMSHRCIAETVGVSRPMVSSVIYGQSWKWLEEL